MEIPDPSSFVIKLLLGMGGDEAEADIADIEVEGFSGGVWDGAIEDSTVTELDGVTDVETEGDSEEVIDGAVDGVELGDSGSAKKNPEFEKARVSSGDSSVSSSSAAGVGVGISGAFGKTACFLIPHTQDFADRASSSLYLRSLSKQKPDSLGCHL